MIGLPRHKISVEIQEPLILYVLISHSNNYFLLIIKRVIAPAKIKTTAIPKTIEKAGKFFRLLIIKPVIKLLEVEMGFSIIALF